MAEVSSSSSSRRNRFKVKRVEAAVGQSDAEGDDNYESDKEVKHFDCFNLRTHRDLDDCGEIEIVCIVLTILVNLSIVDDVHRKKAIMDPSRLKWANGKPTKAIELLHPRLS